MIQRLALYVLVCSFAIRSTAEIAQYPVGAVYPSPINFTQLFSKEFLGPEIWSAQGMNGITTFAKAPPLRCFGSEASTKYDVAVLGML